MLGALLVECDLCCWKIEDVVGRRVSTAMERKYKGTLVLVKNGYVSYTR